MQQALDALYQFIHAVAFRHHCVSRKLLVRECSGDRFTIHGEENYPDVWYQVFQNGRRNDAVGPGHRHIQKNEVGLEFASLLDSIFAIDSFPDIRILSGETCVYSPAKGIVVIGPLKSACAPYPSGPSPIGG